MPIIAFVDTEIKESGKIADIGCVFEDGRQLHTQSVAELTRFLQGADFVCGHNLLAHDLRFIYNSVQTAGVSAQNYLDTLPFSPLLFPAKPYHRLVKDDKLQTEEINNPLNDAKKARDLFHEEVAAFRQLDSALQQIFCELLHAQPQFRAFFRYLDFRPTRQPLAPLIFQKFRPDLCERAEIERFSRENPIELAYALALIQTHHRDSITPRWVARQFPDVERLMIQLRNRPCLAGCLFCNQNLDIFKGLRHHFGFEKFRTYAGEPLQERAVRAAVEQMSLLAVFPTGGGKSITFQLPALMSGQAVRGLTVVISPLQSLMKDQVDNLERAGITEAVTINGLLDPIERAKAIHRVENGSASLLYISPESLRSKSIKRLLLGRNVVRFVVDEAHCFSSWGQDFRVDYLYIGDFIKALQTEKNCSEPIPISCFTATAKRKVVEDICQYFKEKLGLELEIFQSNASRTNLKYQVFEKTGDEEKYQTLRELILEKNCPTIVYVSSRKGTQKLAARLAADGFTARAFHAKLEAAEKTKNQNDFISGEVQIMVATSAFGMGVDKKDVGLVVHFEVSGSLEDYVQEAGRAGRDEKITAECYVLFNEDDLNKHFTMLNQSKLNQAEIQQIWKAIKFLTKNRLKISNSPLEIARKAGWEEETDDLETRVTTAVAALEDAGYVRRGQNEPRVFANSILSKTAMEAIEKINASKLFDNPQQKTNALRIIRKLFSSKSKKWVSDETAEERVDYISDHLGIPLHEVVHIVELLRAERILADAKDLTAFIKRGENPNRSLSIAKNFQEIEQFLLRQFDGSEQEFHLKKLNEAAENAGLCEVSPAKIKTLINLWAIKNWVRKHFSNQIVHLQTTEPPEVLLEKWARRQILVRSVIEFLYEKSRVETPTDSTTEEILVEFSVQELLENHFRQPQLFGGNCSPEDVEDALFFLSRIEALKIEGGFMVVYNRLSIDRLEKNAAIQYKKEDYRKLSEHYEHRVQQIHIVGEYAKKMVNDGDTGALQFVEDYFRLNFSSFLGKYFPGSRQSEIKRNITPAKYRELFQSLSYEQRRIVDDKDSPNIVVAAAPGSGKTKVLVHKLAGLLLMEDVKSEQLLMLTFSRAAATEFKKRLIALIGKAAYFVDIKTFHSYCFDLLGRVGSLEKADKILLTAIEKIQSGEVEPSRITKTVLVVDEAQDMSAEEFSLVKILMEKNEGLRVIAVGDDDQNIFEFRGSDSRHLLRFVEEHAAKKYELTTNFRSRPILVAFANEFAHSIPNRLKTSPVVAHRSESGNLKIVHYRSRHLVVPLVEDLLATDLQGSVCVLTKTNDEAAQIAGLLLRRGRQAKLIQSNDGFSLQNLAEIRFFMDFLQKSESGAVVLEEVWKEAKRAFWKKFRSSSKVEILINLVKDFEATHPEIKYRTDLEAFVRESKIEDFYRQSGDVIFVSTIHKAKGKEFDHVFLLLDGFDNTTVEARRQVYVAVTRAKNDLCIHTNGRHFDHIELPGISHFDESSTWQPPDQIACQLTLADVNLGRFESIQTLVQQLTSGDNLQFVAEGLADQQGNQVLKFSKKFQEKIESYRANGYALSAAKVNFLVWWQGQAEGQGECLVVLPEVVFSH